MACCGPSALTGQGMGSDVGGTRGPWGAVLWHAGGATAGRERCLHRGAASSAPGQPAQPGAGAGVSKPGVTAALVQRLWQRMNTKGISPWQRAAPLEHRERTQEGTLPQQQLLPVLTLFSALIIKALMELRSM